MTEKSPEGALNELGTGLNSASERTRELEGMVLGQRLAFEKCICALALESEERGEVLSEILDSTQQHIAAKAGMPETDDATATVLRAAALAVGDFRRTLSRDLDVVFTVINGGRDDDKP